MKPVLLLTALLCLMSPTLAAADDTPLFRLIGERLSWMAPVAAWKLENERPVEDLAREKVVLEAAAMKARAAGLSGDSVRAFFQAQIDAAKAIQRCWMKRWKTGAAAPPEQAPDLVEEIRPALLRLGTAIVDGLSAALEHGTPINRDDRPAFDEAVAVDCLDAKARDALFDGLLQVRPAQP
jgi:chorismate mutase-like protein